MGERGSQSKKTNAAWFSLTKDKNEGGVLLKIPTFGGVSPTVLQRHDLGSGHFSTRVTRLKTVSASLNRPLLWSCGKARYNLSLIT